MQERPGRDRQVSVRDAFGDRARRRSRPAARASHSSVSPRPPSFGRTASRDRLTPSQRSGCASRAPFPLRLTPRIAHVGPRRCGTAPPAHWAARPGNGPVRSPGDRRDRRPWPSASGRATRATSGPSLMPRTGRRRRARGEHVGHAREAVRCLDPGNGSRPGQSISHLPASSSQAAIIRTSRAGSPTAQRRALRDAGEASSFVGHAIGGDPGLGMLRLAAPRSGISYGSSAVLKSWPATQNSTRRPLSAILARCDSSRAPPRCTG